MRLIPIRDRIIVKRSEASTKTTSGLYIPDSAQEKQSQGVVVAVGSGYLDVQGRTIALAMSVGDTVLFESQSGSDIKFDGENYVILEESDVLAYFKPEQNS